MSRPQTLVPARLEAPMEALLTELGAPGEFPADVLADAERAAAAPDLPDTDWTDVAFVTIDPPGSMDLDQAMHLERRGAGFRVRYAIADVPAFVRPGSPVDEEARRRGQTLYAPHRRVPLHPPVLSEAAASLLPGETRPAYVWVIDLDADAEPVAVDVRRALVRSRERFSFEHVQAEHDRGATPEPFALLPEIGRALHRPGAVPRWCRPPDPRPGGRGGRRCVRAEVPPAVRGAGLERPAVPAHRHGRGRPDAGGGDRHPAHDAGARRADGRSVPPPGQGAGRTLGGRAGSAATTCAPWTRPTPATWRCCTSRPHCSAARGTRPSTARSPSTSCRRRSRPSTPT